MSNYARHSRRKAKRDAAKRRGRTREHPRVQKRSRTTRRAGTKTKLLPQWHPMYGPTGHKPPKYRYPGHSPGRLTRDNIGQKAGRTK